MTELPVTLSTFDVQRLEPLLSQLTAPAAELPDYLAALAAKLAECEETPPVGVPPDVITMNSCARLKNLTTGGEMICTLVFPRNADAAAGRVSVLAPLGAALFGARVGATVEVASPQGVRRFLIEQLLYQPEADGRYDL